jgi:Anti-sigma-K factor rskA/Putative zinc-finger
VMRCEEVRRQLASFAVGEPSPQVSVDIESHLAECHRCSEALQALRSVEALATSAPLRPESPPDLEDRVFAYVQAYEAAQAAPTAAIGPEPPSDLERRSLERAGVLTAPTRSARQRVAMVLAPAFAAAAAVLSFMYMDARSDLGSTEPARTQTGEPAIAGAVPSGAPAGHPMQTIELSGDTVAADLELVHFRHDNYRLQLHAWDVPGCPSTHYYEVWLRGDDGEVSAGSFRVIRPDDIIFNFNVGIDPAEYYLVEVTREPIDGSSGKEGPVVMRGALDPTHVDHD